MATKYRAFNISYGHTDAKEMQNLRALTGDGFIKGVFTYDGALNLGEIDELELQTLTATIPNVALGDAVVAWSCSIDIEDLTVTAAVTAADTVIIAVTNVGASSLDLASATWRLVVWDLT